MSDPNNPPMAEAVEFLPVEYTPSRPTSVTVISILGIVLAALMLIVCVPLSVVFYFIPGVERNSPAIGELKANVPLFAFLIGIAAFSMAMNLLLLAASIWSLKLARWARTGMIVYAILFIVSGIANMIVQFAYVIPITTAPQYLPPEMRNAAGMMRTWNYVGGSIMFLVFLLHPLAILFFYTRRHVVDAFERRARV